MDRKKKSKFFGKLFSGDKTNNCCAVGFEEIPEAGSNPEEETPEKGSEENEKTNTGCGCGC